MFDAEDACGTKMRDVLQSVEKASFSSLSLGGSEGSLGVGFHRFGSATEASSVSKGK